MTRMKELYENEKVLKLLMRISTPLVLSYLVAELYNMADTFFVGNFAGKASVGGLMLVFPVQRLFIALAVWISIGAATNISTKLGEGSATGVRRQMRAADMLTFGCVPLSLIVFFFARPILTAIGGSGAILDEGMRYLSIVIFSQFFIVRIMYLAQVGIALGNTSISMISNALGLVLNIAVDYVLVRVYAMGIAGAGWGTLISQGVSYLYCEVALHRAMQGAGVPKLPGAQPNAQVYRLLAMVGFAGFLLEAEDGFVMAFINRILVHAGGEESIIILGVISKVYIFMFVLMFAVAEAMQPMCAYCHGMGNRLRVKKIFRETLRYSFLLDLVVFLLGLAFTEPLIRIFIRDEEIVRKSIPAFRMMIAAFPFTGFYYVMVHYLQSVEKSRQAIWLCAVRQLAIRIPVSWVMVRLIGAGGIWWSFPISDILSVVAAFWMMRPRKGGFWARKRLAPWGLGWQIGLSR